MFSNYLKTAWRNLLKKKFYSVINLGGLAAGLAVGIIILLWVQEEFSFDRFHAKEKQIFKLENIVGTGTSRQLWTETASPIGVLAKKEIPGVEDVVRICHNGFYSLYRYKDKVFVEEMPFFTDPSFFSVFDFTLIKGMTRNPFPDEHSIVLTESTAKRYFGDEDPIGKVISADNKINFTVRGIIRDFPKNSSIRADMLFPMTLLQMNRYAGNKEGLNLENDFIQFNYATFLLLRPGISMKDLPVTLRNIHLRVKSDDTDVAYVLLPLGRMHLFRSDGSEGGFATVRMFIVIANLILVIACINYVNLSTARSMLRAKEVSLRKIVGAPRIQLFMQFMIETTLLFFFASVLALVLAYFLIPLFNSLSGKELILNLYDYHIWEVILATIVGTLLVSSIYPALLLSSFEPLKAMKGKLSARVGDALFRKVLVVIQFTFSMILITGTLVIGRQLSYIRSRELGYDKDHVLICSMIAMSNHYPTVRSDLLRDPSIKNVTCASENIVEIGGQTGNNWWEGKEKGETLMLSPMAIDKGFMSFFRMNLKRGAAFTGSVSDSAHFILNETAVRAARLKNPVGQKFRLWKTEGTIIGVMKDFHFASMREKIQPAIFYYQTDFHGMLYIKTTGRDAPRAIAALGSEWKKYNPDYPFVYSFLDDNFNNLYKGEERTESLFNVFAAIAIFISCLGLFGLAAYTAQVKTKEIGVRKVLGAGVSRIIALLAADFIRLVIIAILIAIPIAWYSMNRWLQDFAYKTDIGWTVFLAAGMTAVFIALATVCFQSVKAAVTNPVDSLRNE